MLSNIRIVICMNYILSLAEGAVGKGNELVNTRVLGLLMVNKLAEVVIEARAEVCVSGLIVQSTDNGDINNEGKRRELIKCEYLQISVI